MSVVLDPIPDPSTYRRVLRRYDRDPSTPRIRIPGYAVTLTSQRCSLDGRVAFTAFFPPTPAGEAAADRQVKLGWIDETRAWNNAHRAPTDAASIGTTTTTGTSAKPSSVEHVVRSMEWGPLRREASQRGIRTGAKSRADIEAELIAAMVGE